MGIIRTGLDDNSLSSDDSFGEFFPETLETEAIKGLYFQHAHRLCGTEASQLEIDHTQTALINVGGSCYTFPWSTLEDFPESRLSQLRLCTTPEERAKLCDDYDETRHEFFFDRDPVAFKVIRNFLARGKLCLLREICNAALHSELEYWGIDVGHMQPCCRHRLLCFMDDLAKRQSKHEEWMRKRMLQKKAEMEATGLCRLFWLLGEAVENPHSGSPGKVYACISVAMVMITVISLCISTVPELQKDERCAMFVVESICVVWFTFEFVVRFFHAQSKLDFVSGPLNIIDATAILPYYISLLVDIKDDSLQNSTGRSSLDKLGLILRVMRALRILYVMRLARHSVGLQTLGLTMQRSMADFGLLLLFVCVAVTLFSPLVHLAESELAPKAARSPQVSFSSIPASYWWSIISVTTVGYGDMVPYSIPGQLVALMIILSGILIVAFPSTSIFHIFCRTYLDLKEENDKLRKEERGAELDCLWHLCLLLHSDYRERQERLKREDDVQLMGQAGIELRSLQ
uniref:Potassium voltage-gated channel, subfamily G, member 4b n=1 Tax=Myripristis murdjan TaxID=586833 RepID=A0A667ZGP4_9TELE